MKKSVALAVGVGCMVALTALTVSAPVIPGDWARLDTFGKYIPNTIFYDWPPYLGQIGLWLGGMAGLWVGLRQEKTRVIPNIPNRRQLSILMVLVVAIGLGFGLRLHGLGGLPLLIDEIGFAARASDMLHGQRVPIFAPGHNGNPAVYSWMLSGVMEWFGQTRWAMRLPSVVFGTLSIAAVYALGKAWGGRRLGVMAALFTATYPAHVHFSQLALYNIIDPFFAALALVALRRALKGGRQADFVLAGMLGGVAQYFYHGSRLLLVVMGVLTALAWWQAAAPARRRLVQQAGMMTGVLVLVSLPRFAPQFSAGLPVTGNLDGIRLPADAAANSVRALLAWVGQADVSPFWLSSIPLLPLFALLAWGAGVMWAARQRGDGRWSALLLMLVLTTIFGGMIWAAAPLYVRYMTALPALALLVAAGIQSAGRWRRVQAALLAGVVMQGSLLSLRHPAEAVNNLPAGLREADALAQAAARLPTGEAVELVVTSAFGDVERITIADYVAAYGERRAVSIRVK